MSKDTYNEEWTVYYEYLEVLRQSGATNMFGAAPYLQDRYGLDRRKAREVLSSWMTHYDALLEDGVISR
jgi:hypothetical protein